MADALTQAACIDRHVQYPYDIAGRLRPFQRERLRRMLAPVRNRESVLDVGCNSGYVVEFVPSRCRCYGVDVAPELVALARRRLVTATVAPAETLPFPDASIDVVSLGEILEHVFDPAVVLSEAARVARRLVVGSTPHELSPWGPGQRRGPEGHPFHVRCFTEDGLRDTLRAFRTVEIQTMTWDGAPQFYLFAAHV